MRVRRIACLAVLTCILAACSGPEATPTTSPPPSAAAEPVPEPSPTEVDPAELKQENIAAAMQVIDDYWAALDEFGRTDGQDLDEIGQYLGPELWAIYRQVYEADVAAGVRTEGEVEVAETTVAEYLPSELGMERVVILACIDTSGKKAYDGSGTLLQPDVAPRTITRYEVAHQGTDGAWFIDDMTLWGEQEC